MALLDKATLILTPNGISLSKVWCVKPSTDIGFFAFTRSGSATRMNSSKSLQVIGGSNFARLSYRISDCPTILLEGEKTNYCRFSDPASAPTQMTSTNVTFSSNDWNFGLNNKIIFDNSNGAITCAYNNSGTNLTSGTYTISFYAKRQDGGVVRFGAAGTGDAIKDIVVLFQNSTTFAGATYSTTLVRDGIYQCVMTGTSTINSTSFGVRKGTGESANIVEVSGVQIENGAFNTMYIPTSGAPTVRQTELLNFDNLDTYINSNSSAWYLELKNNIPLARMINGTMHIGTSTGSASGWGLRLTQDNTTPQRIKLQKIVNSTPFSIHQTAVDNVKILFNWSGGILTTWVNGIQVDSSAFSITGDIKYARFNAYDRPKNIANCVFFNTSLTTTEAQQLTATVI